MFFLLFGDQIVFFCLLLWLLYCMYVQELLIVYVISFLLLLIKIPICSAVPVVVMSVAISTGVGNATNGLKMCGRR